jgi:hypothetical protein
MATLETLLCLSASNGSFDLSAGLQNLLAISEGSIVSWAAQWSTADQQPSMRTLTTALVIAYLRIHFPKEKETWDLVASKAVAWLRSQEDEWLCASIQSEEALIAAATSWLSVSNPR